MAVSRYTGDDTIKGGRLKGTARAVFRIRRAVKRGQINYTVLTLKENQRLDKIAGQVYGDGRYWWAIAAVSNIGYGLQVPAGTQIKIPELSEVLEFV